MVSPALRTFNDDAPVTLPTKAAVIVPAVKLPEISRATIALAVFAAVAVVAEFNTLPAVEIVASLSLAIVPTVISSLIINDVERVPEPLVWTTPAEARPSIVTAPKLEI